MGEENTNALIFGQTRLERKEVDEHLLLSKMLSVASSLLRLGPTVT